MHYVFDFHTYVPHMFDAWITAFNSVGTTLLASICIHYWRQMVKDKKVIDQKLPFINNFMKNSKLRSGCAKSFMNRLSLYFAWLIFLAIHNIKLLTALYDENFNFRGTWNTLSSILIIATAVLVRNMIQILALQMLTWNEILGRLQAGKKSLMTL